MSQPENENQELDPDLVAIGSEMREELTRAIENACKKIQNLKLGGGDSRQMVSLVLAMGWASWLEILQPNERAQLFHAGTQLIADDLMDKIRKEMQGPNGHN